MSYALSVTQRVAEIKKPSRFLSIRDFKKIQYDDGMALSENENLALGTVGTAVDYLTRVIIGDEPNKAFSIALAGSRLIDGIWIDGAIEDCAMRVEQTRGADTDDAIIAACEISGCYDAYFRSRHFKYPDELAPDADTITNIRTMLGRCRTFIDECCGPVVLSGFTFRGGYTDIVSYGDGDFLFEAGLFDFKTMKSNPRPKHALQLLTYYLMGIASIHEEFNDTARIGFFNPRLNVAHVLDVTAIPKEVLREVSIDVIGYDSVPEGAGETTDAKRMHYFSGGEKHSNANMDFPRVPRAGTARPVVLM